MKTALQLSGICKSFGPVKVLRNIDLTVEKGEFVVFVGPSGCGKSTLLRVIAGLEDATAGAVAIDGEDVSNTPPAKRGIAMVFQSYALYPHLTARSNMTLALRQERQPKDEIARRVEIASQMLSLDDYLERRPAELSGGQRQRVAIGRSIVRKPKIFLFDEPLSNLDAALRMNTRIELAKLHRALSASMIYVTHDQIEAMTLADRIVVLRDGRVEQIGSPMELYNNPVNRFVAGFLGAPSMNFLPAVTIGGNSRHVLGIRPENIRLDDNGQLHGIIVHVEKLGGETNVIVETDSAGQLTVRLFGQHDAKPGNQTGLTFDEMHSYLFDEQGQRV